MPPERKPNQFARLAAVLTLILAFLVVIVTIATSSGDSGDSGSSGDEGSGIATTGDGEPTAKGERAVEEGVWIVREGDTLVSISEETGIDIDSLIDLNPDIDPQTLSTGQRIALREALTETTASGSDADGDVVNEGAGIGDGTGEGDGGPTQDSGTTTSGD